MEERKACKTLPVNNAITGLKRYLYRFTQFDKFLTSRPTVNDKRPVLLYDSTLPGNIEPFLQCKVKLCNSFFQYVKIFLSKLKQMETFLI